MEAAGSAPADGASLRFGVLLGVTGAVLLAAAFPMRRAAAPSAARPEVIASLVLLLIGGMLFFVGGAGAGVAVLFNLLLFGLIVGVIALGYRNREPAWVNLGTLFFAVQVIARYVDWFWALMPRSLFFIGAGALLLLGGLWLERARRGVLKRVEKGEEGSR